jgi:hypothetical protein
MQPTHSWPTEEEVLHLTAALLSKQATAPGVIAAALLSPLAAYLGGRFQYADPDLCYEAAGTAILATVRGESHYDPTQLALDAFLRMAATRDLQNLLEKETRRKRFLIPLESVEEQPDRGNPIQRTDEPTWDDPRLVAELAAFGPPEQLALDLMRGGVRDTADFAGPLGLSHLSEEEQAAEVKRLKDKVKKRLSRAVGGDR